MRRTPRSAGRAGFALGFRVKSGFAIAVVVTGPASAPIAIARRVVELSDPDEAGTRQPYHDGFFHEQEDAREIARRVKIVRRCAKRSIAALLKDDCLVRRRCHRAGLVVGSVIDPKTVGNLHIRAHANEGLLFRTVLEDALQTHGVDCDVIVEKRLNETATAGLRRSTGEIACVLAGFGKALGSPWRAEEKTAATAAWLSTRASSAAERAGCSWRGASGPTRRTTVRPPTCT